jgi:cytochrome d ubiquinol oxidase subunit I
MLFGWQRVSPRLHVAAAILVALGTATSGFWILAADSWMHTPDGYQLRAGIAYPVSWLQVIFNPSFPYRFTHMMTAAYLTTSVVVLAAGARYLIRGEFEAEGRTMMRMGIGMLAILGPLQLLLGDQHGLNTLQYQPAKIAAIEGHWDDDGPADLLLFAIPDEAAERNRAAIAVPHLGSLVLTHSWNGRFAGIKDFPRDQRPPVTSIFFAFRLMVAIGLALITMGLTGALLWWRGKLFTTRWYLHIAARAWWLGFVAILAGWLTTESGRQPYVAYGILRTDQALSPVSAATVATSLTLFVLVYCVLFSIGIYYIHRLIWNGPKGEAVEPVALPQGLPNRPLSVADAPTRESRGQSPRAPGLALQPSAIARESGTAAAAGSATARESGTAATAGWATAPEAGTTATAGSVTAPEFGGAATAAESATAPACATTADLPSTTNTKEPGR